VGEIVVTGGGTGTGYAIATVFAAQCDRVTVTGRREQVLTEAADRLGASYVTGQVPHVNGGAYLGR
jgi:3-oxoacyl-[acyl-carrier protein] reductase